MELGPCCPACAPSAKICPRHIFGGRSTGSSRSRTLTADGVNRACRMRMSRKAGVVRVLHHKPPGRCWLSWQVASPTPSVWPGGSITSFGISGRTGHGRRYAIPAPVSRACSIFVTIGIANTSPSGHWLCTATSRLVAQRGPMSCVNWPINQDNSGRPADRGCSSNPLLLVIVPREQL